MEEPGRIWSASEYRYAFNGKEISTEINSGDYDFGARILDARIGRWLTWDPMRIKFPGLSPYGFAANSPMIIVDAEGKENVIYLVNIPDTKPGAQKIDAYKVAKEANANFEKMGLQTRVVVVDSKSTGGGKFDASKIDPTDAVAVIGNVNAVKQYVSKEDKTPSNYSTLAIPAWEGGNSNPEISENVNEGSGDKNKRGGDFIAVDVNGLKKTQKGLNKSTPEQAAALIIMHGAGHNADTDPHKDLGHTQEGGVMASPEDGGKGWNKEDHPNGASDVIKVEDKPGIRNKAYKEHMKDRFGEKTSKDNYKTNKANPNYKKNP